MASEHDNNKRIAKNTLVLYFRMLFSMIVGLFTSRVILNSLGVEDYGIYNVVGGVVATFAIVSGSLSASVSRYITYELGTGNTGELKKVFSSAVTIQFFLVLVIFLIAETVGLWFLNTQMLIPEHRLHAANWVYQFSFITFAINLISIPYNAAIISHEKMTAFAYISFVDVIGKLVIAYGVYVSPVDSLIFYAIMMTTLSAVLRGLYGWYCKKNFEECRYFFVFDKDLLKKMFGFAGWNFIGASSSILRDQGGNLLINMFFGPTVNAARGIAMHVNSAVLAFVNNFQTALNPQITKKYASGDRDYMMSLIFEGAKLSFYIMLILSLPIIITTPYLLKLWLGIVPDHTANFVRLVLIFSLSETLAGPLVTAMLATGNIRNYQIIVGGIQMMNLPISYIFLKLGYFPEVVLVVAIVVSVCCEMARLCLLSSMIGLPARSFLIKVYLNVILIAILSSIVPVLLNHYLSNDFGSFLLTAILSLLLTCSVIYAVGLNKNERIKFLQFISSLKKRIFK